MSALPKISLSVVLVVGTVLTGGSIAWGVEPPVLIGEGNEVRVWEWRSGAEQQGDAFVICHGMGGTTKGDRFHKLAETLQEQQPSARVLLIDWSNAANRTWYGIPAPWLVAKEIDPVAAKSAEILDAANVFNESTTFIGESFGNYVTAAIALHNGKAARLLAFNPASEYGGYNLPDLKLAAIDSCAFHTYSPYDTRQAIAHRSLLLETPVNASHVKQHTFGVTWLSHAIRETGSFWLELKLKPQDPLEGCFSGIAKLNGTFDDEPMPVQLPTERNDRPALSDLVTGNEQ